MNQPNHTEANPYPGTPRFFRRFRTGPGLFAVLSEPITIYGFSHRSEYPEDHPKEDRAFEDGGVFPGYCFSAVEPNGEWGFTPLDEAAEISEEDFIRARDQEWPSVLA